MNEILKTGGPAFPMSDCHNVSGMSIRDWFAGMALQSLLPLFSEGKLELKKGRPAKESDISEQAYAFADAMLKERSF